MTTVVVCNGCDVVLERYDDDGPYVEKLDTCDRCARDAHEAEYEEARYLLAQEFYG